MFVLLLAFQRKAIVYFPLKSFVKLYALHGKILHKYTKS